MCEPGPVCVFPRVRLDPGPPGVWAAIVSANPCGFPQYSRACSESDPALRAVLTQGTDIAGPKRKFVFWLVCSDVEVTQVSWSV